MVGIWQQDRTSNGGARALVSAWSADGGRSWARVLHPFSRCGGAAPGSAGDFERASDPWVDIAPDGTVHAMALAFSGDALAAGSSSAMLASRSTDGGRSWSAPQAMQRDGDTHFNDKNTLTADRTDARYVYGVWDRLDRSNHGPTLLARSSDGGLSWEPARTLHAPTVSGGTSQTIGNRIVVIGDGPQRGVLVNVFNQIDTVGSISTGQVRVMRSFDKGLSWSAPITVSELRAIGARDPDTGAAIRDGAILPVIAAGPGSRLWVAWQDARFSGGLRDAIALSRSDDAGLTWSVPVAVNRDPAVPAFTPTLHVHSDGRLAITHYDLRSNTPDTTSLLADLWLLTTQDGAAFTEHALARAQPLHFAPLVSGGLFLGDYHGLASAGTDLLPFAVLPNASSTNRTDVVALRTAPQVLGAAATRQHAARAMPQRPPPGSLDAASFARERSHAIQRALRSRPGRWEQASPCGPARAPSTWGRSLQSRACRTLISSSSRWPAPMPRASCTPSPACCTRPAATSSIRSSSATWRATMPRACSSCACTSRRRPSWPTPAR
jgi:hypothetical protein